MDENCYTTVPRSLASIVAMRDALKTVCETLRNNHTSTSNFNSLFTLLNTLNTCLAKDTQSPSLTSCLLDSAAFRWFVADYILKQQGGYHHLGTHRFSSAATSSNQNDFAKEMEERRPFDEQKEKLFEAAIDARKMKTSEIYDLARSCPDFFFVDDMEFYYGGAGRTCADIHMTRMVMSLAEAKRIAKDYVHEHTPPIDYREIFSSLDRDFLGQKSLISEDQKIESIFSNPALWIGTKSFNELLQKSNLSLFEFKTGFSDLSSANEWLRPLVRISCARSEYDYCYNKLHFDPETGCSWSLCEPHS